MVRWLDQVVRGLVVATTLTSSCTVSLAADKTLAASVPTKQKEEVEFDLPPIAPAFSIDGNADEVVMELRLSSMIVSPRTPQIEQWLVRCQPRDTSVWITDYAPRTETESDVLTPIQVTKTEEETQSIHLGVVGSYGPLANAKAAADQSQHRTRSVKFERQAPVHPVTTSGSINRGRGVYFKLRWTSQQILEGEKVFKFRLRVPHHWRGSLFDVSVLAQGDSKSFGWEQEAKILGSANFVVAVYRDHDSTAETSARALADAEHQLRILAARSRTAKAEPLSLPSMLRQVATRLELEPAAPSSHDWLQRVLTQRADPYLDKSISRLPMPIRLAILEYNDRRRDFQALNDKTEQVALEAIAEHQTQAHGAPK